MFGRDPNVRSIGRPCSFCKKASFYFRKRPQLGSLKLRLVGDHFSNCRSRYECGQRLRPRSIDTPSSAPLPSAAWAATTSQRCSTGPSCEVRATDATSLRSNSARSRTMADDPKLRLVSDRTKGEDFESFDRFTQGARYRPRALAPWQPRRKRRKRPDAPGRGKR